MNFFHEKNTVLVQIRSYIITGILVSLPVMITFSIAVWAFNLVDSIVLIPFSKNSILKNIPGVGILIFAGLMVVIGFVAQNFIGKFIFLMGEKIIHKIPIVKSIYSTVKQVFDTILSSNSTAFKGVVLVEYPRKGLWTVAFVTSDGRGEVQSKTKDDVVSLFIPTTPNPTSGFLIFSPEKDLVFLDMKPDEAMKLVISGGIVTPNENPDMKNKNIHSKTETLMKEISIKTHDIIKDHKNSD